MENIMKALYAIILASQFYVWLVSGQTFTNLDFESANIPPGTQLDTEFSANVAIPGWSASAPSGTGTAVVYDGTSLGGAVVSINDSNPNSLFNFTPLQGNYSVILFAGLGGAADSASISQTGMVPLNTQSILMDIAFPNRGPVAGTFTVAVGAQEINLTSLEAFSTYTIYGGSIGSSLDGQIEALTITQFPPDPSLVPPSALEVDDIVFSPNVIPEPGTWALMLCGAGIYAVRIRKRKGWNPNAGNGNC